MDERESGTHHKFAPIYYLLGVNGIRGAKHLPHHIYPPIYPTIQTDPCSGQVHTKESPSSHPQGSGRWPLGLESGDSSRTDVRCGVREVRAHRTDGLPSTFRRNPSTALREKAAAGGLLARSCAIGGDGNHLARAPAQPAYGPWR
jgi:hypothetical protein